MAKVLSARYCPSVPPLPKDSPNGCTTPDVRFLEFLGGSSNLCAVLQATSTQLYIGLIKNRCVDLCDISSMNAPAKKTHKHRPGTVAVRQYHRYRKILPMVVQLQTFVFWSFWEAPQICVPSCRLHRRNYILA